MRPKLKRQGRKENANPTVANREQRFELHCSYCPPNRGENYKPCSKRGKGKAVYKTKRKGR